MESKIKKIEVLAKDIYQQLGTGYNETVYDRAMQVGLRLAKLPYESQKVVEVRYQDHYVGEGFPDLVVDLGDGRLIIELKAVGSIMGVAEETQLRNYMRLLKIRRGLLINFQQPGKKEGSAQLEIKEVHA